MRRRVCLRRTHAARAQLCTDTVDLVLSTDGNAPSQPQQDSDAHHAAPKIFKETCAIDFSLTAKRIYDFVRGLSPAPGAWCLLTPRDANAPAQVLKIYKTAKTHESVAGVHLSQVHQTITQQIPTTNQPV